MSGVSLGGATEDPASHETRGEVDGTERQLPAGPGPSAAAPGGSLVAKRQDAAEIAKELVVDLRSELPRIDARAAAGVALTAAVLVSVVSQAPAAMPIYAIAVVAAALLTIALLLFLMVLLPTPTLLSHQSLLRAQPGRAGEPPEAPASGSDDTVGWISRAVGRHPRKREAEIGQLEEMGRQLAAQLAGMDRIEYHATVAMQIGAQLRIKQRLLLLAFVSGSLGVAALALGASWALLLGWR